MVVENAAGKASEKPAQETDAIAQEPQTAPSANPNRSVEGRLDSQFIHVIAQSVPNLPPLRDDAAAALAPDAEYRIREVIQDALKFMRHAKRRHMTTGDINSALRLRNVEPLYGFGQNSAPAASGVPLQDLGGGGASAAAAAAGTAAAEGAGGEKGVSGSATAGPGPGGASVGDANDTLQAGSGSGAGHGVKFSTVEGSDDLFFVEDAEVNLKALIEAPLPPVPLDYAVSAHWLAIEGVQPALPQNPVYSGDGGEGDGASASPVGSGPAKDKPAAKEPVVKPRVKHILGKELQLYYEHVTAAIIGNDVAQREACLTSVAEEPGLAQLLPYFTLFIRDSVKKSLKNLPVLFSLMRLARALLVNPTFQIELYLHQLLPAIISCLVGKRLCLRPRENHWALRDFAAEIISDVCAKFSKKYTDFQPRITKTLKSAIQDASKPMTTHYGAIVGLGALGFRVVDLLVIPLMKDYTKLVLDILKETESKLKSTRRLEAVKVYGALAWAANVSRNKVESPALQADVSSLESAPADEMDRLLLDYTTVFPKLYASHAQNFFPRSAFKDAANISANIFQAAKDSAPSGVSPASRATGSDSKKPVSRDENPNSKLDI